MKPGSDENILIIAPGLAERHYWRDLWRYRELFYVLAWRDISVRYKQTIIGVLWALLRPLLTMLVFTLVFSRIANLPSEGNAPYALMVFAGLLPWQFFSTSLAESSNSLIDNSNLISKVYFPRLIVPTASVVVSFADFLISFIILLALMIWYQFMPGMANSCPPPSYRHGFSCKLGPGAMDCLPERQVPRLPLRDPLYRPVRPVRFAGGFQLRLWCRSSGACCIQSTPWSGVIDGFRWAILGSESTIYLPGFLLSWVLIVFFLWVGIRQFRKMEKSFADLI